MKRATVLGAILALVASLAVAADSKTDFSGTWKENMEKGTAPKGSGMTSYTTKIEQKGDARVSQKTKKQHEHPATLMDRGATATRSTFSRSSSVCSRKVRQDFEALDRLGSA